MSDPYFKFIEMMKESQWWGPARLHALQKKGLQRILLHAWQHAPAYRERLAPLFDAAESPDLSKWDDIPILTRKEAQTRAREFYARQVPAQAGETFFKQTSGSTGMPLQHRSSVLLDIASQAAVARRNDWFGIDANKSCAVFANTLPEASHLPDGAMQPEWQRGFPEGISFWLDHKLTNSAQKLAWLRRKPTDYLVTTPNIALSLVLEAENTRTEVPRYNAVMLGGEVLTSTTEAVLRERMSDTLVNSYGSEECGRLAVWCPEANNMHVHEELCLVEILDENNQPTKPGQMGRVVVTSFYNFAMPLIRYAVGDYAEVPFEPCSCGRSSRSLTRIAGRERQLFRFADGTSFWPSLRIEEFQAIVPFQQWQLVQDRLDHIKVCLILPDIDIEFDHIAFKRALRATIRQEIEVDISLVNTIPRDASGKFEEFKSMI